MSIGHAPSPPGPLRRAFARAWTQLGRGRRTIAAAGVAALVMGPALELRADARAAQSARAHNPSILGPLQAVWTGHSYAYLLWPNAPATDGEAPLLIDAGSDPQARAIAAALVARGLTLEHIAHVLLTHGHVHHTAGLLALPHARVHLAQADGALALGDVGPDNAVLRLLQRLQAPVPRRHAQLAFLVPGQRLQLAGHALTVLPLPGHTRGSVGFLWRGGLLAGDAVFGPSVCADALLPPPTWSAAEAALSHAVLARVPPSARAFVADGHTGINRRCACAERPPPP